MSQNGLLTLIREIALRERELDDQLCRRQPQDKAVNSLRTSLRDKYQELLLDYSCAKESDGVEARLWMQTSDQFISSYEQSLTALDQDRHSADIYQHFGKANSPQRPPPRDCANERSRLLQQFKHFLADEEKSWEAFVRRLLSFFDITEARKVLLGLELPTNKLETNSSADIPPQESEARSRTLGRAIAFLGNAARYREHYNESKGRPPAGSGKLARNSTVSGSPTFFKPRIYEKARRCYEQARKLVPDEGYPLHQLAILESLKNDTFNSTIHAYHALCAQRRDESAVDHLEKTLSKALDEWKQKVDQANPTALDATSPTNAIYLRVDLFKDQVVVLHALWHSWSKKVVAGTNSMLPNHGETVLKSFIHLVSERHLPDYMILDAIMLSQAAFWKHHHPCSTSSESQLSFRPHNLKASTTSNGSNTQIEWAILDHLLDLYRSLLEIGESEVQKLQETDSVRQHVSPTFERMLPALRIASKWLRANYQYLLADKEFEAISIAEKHPGIKVPQVGSSKISYHSAKTIGFWKAYATFTEMLSTAFLEKVPPLDGPLEEDEKLNGFAPLQRLMRSTNSGSDQQSKVEDGGLKRISDLLVDAKALAQLEESPLSLIDGHFSFRSDLVEDKAEELGEHIIRGVLGVLDDEDEDEEKVQNADVSALNAKKRRPSDSGSVEARKDARNTRRRMSPPLPTTSSEPHTVFPSALDMPHRYQLAWSGFHDRLLPKEQHHGMTSRPLYSEYPYNIGRGVVIGAGLSSVAPRVSQDYQKVYPLLPQRQTHQASRS